MLDGNDAEWISEGAARAGGLLDAAFVLASVKRAVLGLEPNRVHVDGYIVERRIGQGGGGIVYQVRDEVRGERVALKVLTLARLSERQRLAREFRVMADLVHPNLVRLYELGEAQHGLYFTMELVDGIDLERALSTAARAGHWAQVRDVMRQLASALSHIHSRGRVHCDIKPANVLVTPEGRVVVLDFGLAEHSSQKGAFGATVAASSPEVLQGKTSCDPARDCYCMGAILCRALVGQEGPSGPELARRLRATGAPSDVQALTLSLLESQPRDRATAEHVATMLGSEAAESDGAFRFVGRRQELGELQHAAGQVGQTSARLVFITGAPGTGKTALVTEFLKDLGNESWVRLEARCFEREAFAFSSLDELFEGIIGHVEQLPKEVQRHLVADAIEPLVRVFPVFERLSVEHRARAHGEMGGAQQARAVQALRTLLKRLVASWRIVLWIEDGHFCDADSAAVLRDLFRAPGCPELLLLVTFRPDVQISNPGFGRILDEFRREHAVHHIDLAGLDPEDALDLGRGLLPRLPLPSVERVVAEAQGNPYFMQELARGSLGPTPHVSFEILLEGRLGNLSPHARRLLEVLCVAGGPLERVIAFRAAAVEVIASDVVFELRQAHLVAAHGARRSAALEVYHAHVRAALLRQLSSERKSEVHLDLARAVAAEERPDEAALAWHYFHGGDRGHAFVFAVRAARAAFDLSAFASAAELFAVAVQCAPDTAPRGELEVRRAEALRLARQGEAAGQAFLDAAAHFNVPEKLELQTLAASEWLRSAKVDEGRALLRELLPYYGLKLPSGATGIVFALGVLLLQRGLTSWLLCQRRLGRTTASERQRLNAFWNATQGLLFVDTNAGAALALRYMAAASRSSDQAQKARALAMEAMMRSGVSRPGPRADARLSHLLSEAEHLADVSGDPTIRANVLQYSTAVYLQQASFRRAATIGRQAAALIEETNGSIGDLVAVRQAELVALQFLGQNKLFSKTCREIALVAQSLGDRYALASLRSMSHIERVFADDVAGAHREIDAILRDWPHEGFMVQHLTLGLGRARVYLYAGQARAAFETMEEFWPKLERSPFVHHGLISSDAREWYGRAAAAVYAEEGDLRCRRIALRIARRLDRGPFACLAGTANVLRAAVCRREGQAEKALRLLRSARQTFAEHDMLRDAAVVDFCLGSGLPNRAGQELREGALRFFEEQEFRDPYAVVRTFGAGCP